MEEKLWIPLWRQVINELDYSGNGSFSPLLESGIHWSPSRINGCKVYCKPTLKENQQRILYHHIDIINDTWNQFGNISTFVKLSIVVLNEWWSLTYVVDLQWKPKKEWNRKSDHFNSISRNGRISIESRYCNRYY